MKIWIVKHHQNNGESYEDNYCWDEFDYFSTYRKAITFYCDKILNKYDGSYTLIEKTLDTQEETELEKSPWGGYTRELWPEDDPDYYIDNPDYQDYDSEDNYDPDMYSYWNADLEKWRYGGYDELNYLNYPEEDSRRVSEDEREEEVEADMLLAFLETREIPIIREWLVHKGENYQIFREIKECELNKLIKNLKEIINCSKTY